MVEKYVYEEAIKNPRTGKWENVSNVVKMTNDKIVLNKKTIIPIREHFFYVRDELGSEKSIFGDRLSKVSFPTYSMMWNVKKNKYNHKDCFESNLKPVRKWMIENVDVPMKKMALSKFYFDIENDFSLDTVNTPKPITAIASFSNELMRVVQFIWRSDFEKKVEKYEPHEFIMNVDIGKTCPYPVSVRYYDTEYEMLSDYMDMVDSIRPDLQLSWNGDWFDFVYLINRCSKLGVDYSKLALYGVKLEENKFTNKIQLQMDGSFSFDMLVAYKLITANDLNTYKLGVCANDILGDTKLEIELKDAWHKDPEALIRYNIQDVLLLIDIDDELGLVDFFDQKRLMMGCEWDDVFLNSKLLDVYFLRKAKDQKFHLPDPVYGFAKTGFIGAYVVEPKAGMYEWIIALDLSSLYPNIIIQFNISPETMDDFGSIILKRHSLPNYVSPKEKLGFIPSIIGELQEVRKVIKKEMYTHPTDSIEYKLLDNKQFVTKGTINSIYGVLGYEKFRLYDKRLAESVTIMGQEIIKYTGDIIRAEGHKVVYGDTDSTYVKINAQTLDDAVKIGKELRDLINKKYTDFVKKYGCDENTNLEMEFEAVMRQMFIAGNSSGKGLKKKYAYEQVWKDGKEDHKMGFKGFEVVRSNASAVTKEVQKKLFGILFDKKIDKNDKKQIFEVWLNQYKKDLREMKYDYSYFAIPQTIKKRLNDYKVTNPAVRSSEYANKYMETNIGIDTKIKIIYLKGIVGSPHTDEICFEDELDFKNWMKDKDIKLMIDWDLMIEKLIGDKIKNIYTTMNWAGIGQNTLNF